MIASPASLITTRIRLVKAPLLVLPMGCPNVCSIICPGLLFVLGRLAPTSAALIIDCTSLSPVTSLEKFPVHRVPLVCQLLLPAIRCGRVIIGLLDTKWNLVRGSRLLPRASIRIHRDGVRTVSSRCGRGISFRCAGALKRRYAH